MNFSPLASEYRKDIKLIALAAAVMFFVGALMGRSIDLRWLIFSIVFGVAVWVMTPFVPLGISTATPLAKKVFSKKSKLTAIFLMTAIEIALAFVTVTVLYWTHIMLFNQGVGIFW